MTRLLIALCALLILGGCGAYSPAACHTAGEDYTAADACH
jgi:hypothetical protein